jgi:hypothetical protein
MREEKYAGFFVNRVTSERRNVQRFKRASFSTAGCVFSPILCDVILQFCQNETCPGLGAISVAPLYVSCCDFRPCFFFLTPSRVFPCNGLQSNASPVPIYTTYRAPSRNRSLDATPSPTFKIVPVNILGDHLASSSATVQRDTHQADICRETGTIAPAH